MPESSEASGARMASCAGGERDSSQNRHTITLQCREIRPYMVISRAGERYACGAKDHEDLDPDSSDSGKERH